MRSEVLFRDAGCKEDQTRPKVTSRPDLRGTLYSISVRLGSLGNSNASQLTNASVSELKIKVKLMTIDQTCQCPNDIPQIRCSRYKREGIVVNYSTDLSTRVGSVIGYSIFTVKYEYTSKRRGFT